jgi:hypothetical protein
VEGSLFVPVLSVFLFFTSEGWIHLFSLPDGFTHFEIIIPQLCVPLPLVLRNI